MGLVTMLQPDDFPGARRFNGLGELPPEALRILWTVREPVSPVQLQPGLEAGTH
jgi:hypothetical protein